MYKFLSFLFLINLFLFPSGVTFAQIINDAPEPIDFPQTNFSDYFGEEFIIDENLKKEAVEFFETNEIESNLLPVSGGNVSCFDNYKFGSIQANIKTNIADTVSGITVPFFGDIKNNNPYPIVNGTLYVKVFQVGSDTEKNPNGPDVVDQFIVVKGLNLNSNESKPIEFEWKVPAFAKSGKYQVATFFVANHKYNLLGLTFTDDVVGNIAEFTVVDGKSTGVYFDKSTVKINDKPYFFAAFPPKLNPQDTIIIKATVVNSTNKAVSVPVVFKTFNWDAMHQANTVQEKEGWVSVPARSSAVVTFEVLDRKYPVYLSEIVLKYKDTKSILNPRFVLGGVDRLRINFPAVKQYPLIKNQEVELFACFHNTTENVVQGRLVLQIMDQDNNLIHEHEFSGNISGDMMATLDKFVPKNSYSTFTIKASLYQGDELVDQDTVYYRCENFNACGSSGGENLFLLNWLMNNLIISGVVLVILIVLLISLVFSLKSKPKVQKLIILLLVLSPAFFWDVDKAHAESVMWTLPSPVFVFSNTTSLGSGGGSSNNIVNFGALQNVTATVRYNIRVLNQVTGEVVACGSSVPVGTRLKFEYVPHRSEDITWFGTGGVYDSPYGSWKIGGAAPANLCVDKNYIQSENTEFGGLITKYTDLSVQPPNKAIGGLPANCTNVGDNKDCIFSSPATYNALFKYSGTYGRFHYGFSNTGGGGFQNFGALGASACRTSSAGFLVTNSSNYNLISAWRLLNYMSVGGTGLGSLPISFSGITYRGKGPVWFELQKPAYNALVAGWGSVTSHIAITSQQISCPITVGPAAEILNVLQSPVVSRSACLINQAGNEIPYTFMSLDSGKNIRFLIDWNNDGSVDQILPTIGFTRSPSVRTSRLWSDSGVKTFSATIQNEEGLSSLPKTYTSSSDCPALETGIYTEEVHRDADADAEGVYGNIEPGSLFEGGIRQIITNQKCIIDLNRSDLSTCTLTKDNQAGISIDPSVPFELTPGRYNISCNKSNGQVLASPVVCLFNPDVREI